MISIPAKLTAIEESATLNLADRIREQERKGRRIVKLQTGDPDQQTPPAIIEAAYGALKAGETHYSSTRGLPELRRAIADKMRRINSVDYDPQNEVLVTHGAVHAIFASILSLVGPGDEVILLDPCWMAYVAATRLAGGVPIRVASTAANHFRLDVGAIETHVTSRTRLIVLNSPCNPTGYVAQAGELQTLAALIRDRDLFAISDEVYETLVYDGEEHVSLASLPGMKERTITVNSFSKSYAMTGWRIGYLAAPQTAVSQILKVSQYSITNVAPFIQRGALAALTDVRAMQFPSQMKIVYSRRRTAGLSQLKSIPEIRAFAPRGAFYFFIDVSAFSRHTAEFASHFLDTESVGVVPGSSFGNCGEGFIRMSFASPDQDLTEGISRLAHFVSSKALN